MKGIINLLLIRNVLVALAFMLLLAGFRVVPYASVLPWPLIPIAFFFCLLWANGVLTKRGRPGMAVLLSVLLFPILGFPAAIGSQRMGRRLLERKYEAQGFQMVVGCNGGAAHSADGQVRTIKERLAMFANSPDVNTNVIVQLQSAYVVAQERARIMREDCGWRGHCETFPWKTNWATIKQALTASDKMLFEQ